jgi:hypothetical protein
MYPKPANKILGKLMMGNVLSIEMLECKGRQSGIAVLGSIRKLIFT